MRPAFLWPEILNGAGSAIIVLCCVSCIGDSSFGQTPHPFRGNLHLCWLDGGEDCLRIGHEINKAGA